MSWRSPVRAHSVSRPIRSACRARWVATCARVQSGSRLGARQSSSATAIVSPKQPLRSRSGDELAHHAQLLDSGACATNLCSGWVMRSNLVRRPAVRPFVALSVAGT